MSGLPEVARKWCTLSYARCGAGAPRFFLNSFDSKLIVCQINVPAGQECRSARAAECNAGVILLEHRALLRQRVHVGSVHIVHRQVRKVGALEGSDVGSEIVNDCSIPPHNNKISFLLKLFLTNEENVLPPVISGG